MKDENRVEITEGWELGADRNGFHLFELYESEGDDGEIAERSNVTYHRSLMQVMRKIRREESRKCDTVEQIIDALETSIELDKEQVSEVLERRYPDKKDSDYFA